MRLRLTGERATDAADASGTLLFDVARRRWSDEVLERARAPARVAPAGARVAGGRGAHRRRHPGRGGSGRPGGGRARRRRRSAGAALGRARHLRRRLRRPARASPPIRRAGSTPSATPCRAAGTRWASCSPPPARCAGFATRSLPGESYESLIAEAERWPPGAEGLLFLPYLAGERTPHADPNARGAFVGLTLRHDRGALVRAVLEGVAFGLRDSLELLADARRRASRSARASGGGARSDLWLRIVASVLGIPLERAVAEEGAAYGAALLGGVAAGVFADVHEAVAACVRVRDGSSPSPPGPTRTPADIARYRALYPALRPLEDT